MLATSSLPYAWQQFKQSDNNNPITTPMIIIKLKEQKKNS
jgi:hypothetical protein